MLEPPWQSWSLASCGLLGSHYPHCETRNASHDLSFCFIFELANPTTRSWMWNQNELGSLEFAPGAHIPVSQFDEVDWPLVLCLPFDRQDLLYAGVNLHKR